MKYAVFLAYIKWWTDEVLWLLRCLINIKNADEKCSEHVSHRRRRNLALNVLRCPTLCNFQSFSTWGFIITANLGLASVAPPVTQLSVLSPLPLHSAAFFCACMPWVHLIPPFAASWHSKLTLLWDFGWSVSPLSRWWEQHKGGDGSVNVSMSGNSDREHLSLAYLPWPGASMTRPE